MDALFPARPTMSSLDTDSNSPGIMHEHDGIDTSTVVPNAVQFERIHALWDELVDHDTTHTEAAMDCLLQGLCTLVDAQNASWIGAVRMGEPLSGDPIKGWRPRSIQRLHTDPANLSKLGMEVRKLEHGEVDPSTIRTVSFAGRFRVHLLKELVPDNWFESELYRNLYLERGYTDAIWAGVPINQDAECYFGVFRDKNAPAFSTTECGLMAHALRGLRWFMRQQMLTHGLVVASSPLTAMERNVLHGLLAGLTEKQIAESQGHAFNTTHSHVKRLFRKFGVSNRAALMALWLGQPASD